MTKEKSIHKSKSRIWISILSVVIVLCLTNRYWLGFISVPIQFDVKGGGNKCKVEVLLNYKDDEEFKKMKHSSQTFDLQKNSHIEMNLRCLKPAKRIRIVLSNLEQNQSISIENLMFYDQKLPIENGEKVRIERNEDKFTLTYLEPLPVVKKSWEVDYKLLVIIAVFSYLLAVICIKLIDYNWGRKRCVIDVLFLALLFTCLFFPMSSLNKEEISTQENRTLAKWKSMFLPNGNLNFDFGKDFNEYFNDRFKGREEMVSIYYNLNIISTNRFYENKFCILDKRSGFLFSKSFNSVNMFLRNNLFSDNELNKIRQNIINLKNLCDKRGIKLYLLLDSDKESIYPEYYTKSYVKKTNPTRLDQIYDLLLNIQGANVVFPKSKLLEHKSIEDVFQKNDTHMSSAGSYIEYSELINTIKREFECITPVDKDKIMTKESSQYGDIGRELSKTWIKIYEIERETSIHPKSKTSRLIDTKKYNNGDDLFLHYFNPNKMLTVSIIGDSFHQRYVEVLAENFKELNSVKFGSGRNFDLNEELKAELFPSQLDILIIETTERFLQRFLYLDYSF